MWFKLPLYVILLLLIFAVATFASDKKAGDPEPISKNITVSINSAPSGAEVWIDAHNSGRLTPCEFPSEIGEKKSFDLRLDGYFSELINTTSFYNTDIYVSLRRINSSRVGVSPYPIKVNIHSNPEGAEVWKYGKDTRKTTPFSDTIGAYDRMEYDIQMDGRHHMVIVDANGAEINNNQIDIPVIDFTE
jgi:hypothetical protein